jgi:hypothetical protein
MNLVVVGTFYEPMQARMALLRLEAEGIHAVLENETLLQQAWLLGQAVGHVKLLVAESEAERACQILEQEPAVDASELDRVAKESSPETGSKTLFRSFYPEEDEVVDEEEQHDELSSAQDREGLEEVEQEAEPNAKEQLVDRALRGSVITFFCFPLAFLVTYALFRILMLEEPLRPKYRKKLIWACILHAPILLLLLTLVRNLMSS